MSTPFPTHPTAPSAPASSSGPASTPHVAAPSTPRNSWERAAGMMPLPGGFGRNAPYIHHDFPEMGPIAHADVQRVTETVQHLAPMLPVLAPENMQFSTSDAGRQPTMYFQQHTGNNGSLSASGRVRQEHPSGPAVYVDQHPRSHLFSTNESLLDVDHQYQMEDQGINAVPLSQARDGMHHIETHHNDPNYRRWFTAHASGGTLLQAPVSDHEVDRRILATALQRDAVVDDRRN